MKRSALLVVAGMLVAARLAQADFVQTFTGFQNGGVIPDGSLVGLSDTRNVVTAPGGIADVSVTLNLSGGWNGDLYAYLVHDTGFAVLLNRVGSTTGNNAGYGNAGMNNVVLNDAYLNNDIHWYGGAGVPTGNYSPDGRNIDPRSGGAALLAANRTAMLSSFNNLNPNGNWTLFLADVSGSDQSTLQSWTLNIAAVPEPRSLIEGGLAALFLGGLVGLYRFKHVPGSRLA
jgi:hypothetical protein